MRSFFLGFSLTVACLMPLALYETRDTWTPVDDPAPVEPPPAPAVDASWAVIVPMPELPLVGGEQLVEEAGALHIMPAPTPLERKRPRHARVEVKVEHGDNNAPIIE